MLPSIPFTIRVKYIYKICAYLQVKTLLKTLKIKIALK